MMFAVVLCLLGLALVLVAVYRDEAMDAPGPALPEWEPVPSPSEVGRSDFPLAFPGYDPASVEVHLDLLRRAYTDLYEVTTPELRERARQRALLRSGRDPGPPGTRLPAEDDPGEDDQWDGVVPEDALRVEAALASVEPGDGEPEAAEPRVAGEAEDGLPESDHATVAGSERT
jgi:hypothetical protein